MRAMVLEAPRRPLVMREVELGAPRPGQVLIEVRACGVCRTDLHLVDGELPHPKMPVIPGHEVIGVVLELGSGVEGFELGQRVGVPWLGSTCGSCLHCRAARENLCEAAEFTGYTLHGGYAERVMVDVRYCFVMDSQLSDAHAAPLMCAGLIGYRALGMAGDAARLGLYGFGAAAHIVTQLAVHEGREVYAFTKRGDDAKQRFAKQLGAVWAGDAEERPPAELDAAILFAPAGELVPLALRAVRPGGVVICAGIHMSDIPSFPYELLWRERSLRSVANLTRADGTGFMQLLKQVPIATTVHGYALEDANRALDDLRAGRFEGAAVLVPR